LEESCSGTAHARTAALAIFDQDPSPRFRWRVHAVLQAEHGYPEKGTSEGSLNRIKALMRTHCIRAKTRRKFKATPDSNHKQPIAPNRLAEPEHPSTGPNQAFVSDITYIRSQEGWLYLAAVMDLYTRAIVGWAIKPRMATDLVLDALTMAWFRKPPEPGRYSISTGVVSTLQRPCANASGITACNRA